MKAIVFDIGEVLIKLNFSQVMNLRKVASASTDLAIHSMNHWKSYDLFERGGLNESSFLDQLNQELGLKLTLTEFKVIWNSVLGETVTGIEALLKNLSERYPLFALTNSNETHIHHFKNHYPWVRYFTQILTSYELNCRKPEPLIYKKLIAITQTTPKEILFFDDRPENVEGAKQLGIQAFLCQTPEIEIPQILTQLSIDY